MEEVIILTPDESLVIFPGEELKPGGVHPLRIRFGLLHFPLAGNNPQGQICNAIKEYLQYAVPEDWQVITSKHLRIEAENTETLVQIVPNRIAWKRSAKGRQYIENEIDRELAQRDSGEQSSS